MDQEDNYLMTGWLSVSCVPLSVCWFAAIRFDLRVPSSPSLFLWCLPLVRSWAEKCVKDKITSDERAHSREAIGRNVVTYGCAIKYEKNSLFLSPLLPSFDVMVCSLGYIFFAFFSFLFSGMESMNAKDRQAGGWTGDCLSLQEGEKRFLSRGAPSAGCVTHTHTQTRPSLSLRLFVYFCVFPYKNSNSLKMARTLRSLESFLCEDCVPAFCNNASRAFDFFCSLLLLAFCFVSIPLSSWLPPFSFSI